jgi:hypothetical protein
MFLSPLNRNPVIFQMSFFLLVFSCLYSCTSEKRAAEKEISIVTETMDFQMPDTIYSGWQTFRYFNKSYETHFFLLDKYPEGKTIEDGKIEVIQPFQDGMDLINEGRAEEGYAEFNRLPAWFFEVVFLGGSGMVSPGQTSVTTLKMEPGYYVVECYVKMQNGMFHSAMGMLKELIVLEDSTSQVPPDPDVRIEISSTGGIVILDEIRKGNQTFRVHFIDQKAHEHFVGHDVNLVKVEGAGDLAKLEKWMDWSDPEGLITPAPEGFTFLGGVNEMPGGSVGYFNVDLPPGAYALISEVPKASSKGMLKTFTVME